jgi:hypothetical protein
MHPVRTKSLAEYSSVVSERVIEELRELAEPLRAGVAAA